MRGGSSASPRLTWKCRVCKSANKYGILDIRSKIEKPCQHCHTLNLLITDSAGIVLSGDDVSTTDVAQPRVSSSLVGSRLPSRETSSSVLPTPITSSMNSATSSVMMASVGTSAIHVAPHTASTPTPAGSSILSNNPIAAESTNTTPSVLTTSVPITVGGFTAASMVAKVATSTVSMTTSSVVSNPMANITVATSPTLTTIVNGVSSNSMTNITTAPASAIVSGSAVSGSTTTSSAVSVPSPATLSKLSIRLTFDNWMCPHCGFDSNRFDRCEKKDTVESLSCRNCRVDSTFGTDATGALYSIEVDGKQAVVTAMTVTLPPSKPPIGGVSHPRSGPVEIASITRMGATASPYIPTKLGAKNAFISTSDHGKKQPSLYCRFFLSRNAIGEMIPWTDDIWPRFTTSDRLALRSKLENEWMSISNMARSFLNLLMPRYLKTNFNPSSTSSTRSQYEKTEFLYYDLQDESSISMFVSTTDENDIRQDVYPHHDIYEYDDYAYRKKESDKHEPEYLSIHISLLSSSTILLDYEDWLQIQDILKTGPPVLLKRFKIMFTSIHVTPLVNSSERVPWLNLFACWELLEVCQSIHRFDLISFILYSIGQYQIRQDLLQHHVISVSGRPFHGPSFASKTMYEIEQTLLGFNFAHYFKREIVSIIMLSSSNKNGKQLVPSTKQVVSTTSSLPSTPSRESLGIDSAVNAEPANGEQGTHRFSTTEQIYRRGHRRIIPPEVKEISLKLLLIVGEYMDVRAECHVWNFLKEEAKFVDSQSLKHLNNRFLVYKAYNQYVLRNLKWNKYVPTKKEVAHGITYITRSAQESSEYKRGRSISEHKTTDKFTLSYKHINSDEDDDNSATTVDASMMHFLIPFFDNCDMKSLDYRLQHVPRTTGFSTDTKLKMEILCHFCGQYIKLERFVKNLMTIENLHCNSCLSHRDNNRGCRDDRVTDRFDNQQIDRPMKPMGLVGAIGPMGPVGGSGSSIVSKSISGEHLPPAYHIRVALTTKCYERYDSVGYRYIKMLPQLTQDQTILILPQHIAAHLRPHSQTRYLENIHYKQSRIRHEELRVQRLKGRPAGSKPSLHEEEDSIVLGKNSKITLMKDPSSGQEWSMYVDEDMDDREASDDDNEYTSTDCFPCYGTLERKNYSNFQPSFSSKDKCRNKRQMEIVLQRYWIWPHMHEARKALPLSCVVHICESSIMDCFSSVDVLPHRSPINPVEFGRFIYKWIYSSPVPSLYLTHVMYPHHSGEWKILEELLAFHPLAMVRWSTLCRSAVHFVGAGYSIWTKILIQWTLLHNLWVSKRHDELDKELTKIALELATITTESDSLKKVTEPTTSVCNAIYIPPLAPISSIGGSTPALTLSSTTISPSPTTTIHSI